MRGGATAVSHLLQTLGRADRHTGVEGKSWHWSVCTDHLLPCVVVCNLDRKTTDTPDLIDLIHQLLLSVLNTPSFSSPLY